MMAKAVANHTTAAFIRVVGSEFVQKYLGEVSRWSRFQMTMFTSTDAAQIRVSGNSGVEMYIGVSTRPCTSHV